MHRVHNNPVKETMFWVHEGAWQLASLAAGKTLSIYLTSLLCNEKFSEKGSLKMHLHTHGDKKPYMFVKHATKCFPGKKNLKRAYVGAYK